jgi:hypothetical protein
MVIPEEYIIQKFYQFSGNPTYNKFTNVYNGSCPSCREGKSWGRKRRLFFLPKDNIICCHNCGWYGDPIKWVCEVNGCTFRDIVLEVKRGAYGADFIENYLSKSSSVASQPVDVPDIPKDSINLFDDTQVEYYKDNVHVQNALSIVKSRRLREAVNKPKTLWFTLNDRVHKNRIILPFYHNNKISHYQSRSIYDTQTPKYLSKQSSDKLLFNIDNVISSISTIFITEGPIDSFFIENGIAVAGIQENSKTAFTVKQKEQLNRYMLHEKIWVLDSQWCDAASLSKSNILCEEGARVFIWPENIGTKYKDVNDLCVGASIDRVPHKFIKENTYTGLKGKVLLSRI